jgi:hypothetical protein
MAFQDIVFSPISLVVLCLLAIWPLKKLVTALEISGLRRTLQNQLCSSCRRILGWQCIIERSKGFSQKPLWEIECPRCHAKATCPQEGTFFRRASK